MNFRQAARITRRAFAIFPEFLVADQLLGQMFPDRHGRPNAVALVLRVALTEQQPAVFKKRENSPRDGSIARSLFPAHPDSERTDALHR